MKKQIKLNKSNQEELMRSRRVKVTIQDVKPYQNQYIVKCKLQSYIVYFKCTKKPPINSKLLVNHNFLFAIQRKGA